MVCQCMKKNILELDCLLHNSPVESLRYIYLKRDAILKVHLALGALAFGDAWLHVASTKQTSGAQGTDVPVQ